MGKSFPQMAVFVALFLFLTKPAKAQIQKPGATFGGYLIYASPQGNYKKDYNFGGGGEIFGGIGYGKTFIIATAGFSAFQATSNNNAGTLTYVPFKVGLKQYFLAKHLFINGDIGVASVKNKIFKESQFTRGIGAGVKLLGVEAALYYDGWKNKNTGGFSNSMEVKFGWSFSL